MIINNYRTFITTCLILTVTIFGLISCIEEYWPEYDDQFVQILVVDGKITNESGPYTVKISTTNSLDSIPYSLNPKYDFKEFSGALVSIHDEDGNIEILTETEPGIYQTSASGMQGIIGKNYKITFSTPSGKSYESTFEELLPPTAVEDAYYVEEQEYSDYNHESFETGLKFHVTSAEALGNTGNLYWEMEETYEYHAAYKIEYVYNGYFNDPGWDYNYEKLYNVPEMKNQDSLYYCWSTGTLNEIFTENTDQLNIPKVENLPLNFISYDNEKLDFKYSVVINQYTISNEAQDYLERVNDQNTNQEGLYASQPYQIRGNITNVEDSREPVLGYFMAASKEQSERLFYTPPYVHEIDTFRTCEILKWDQPYYNIGYPPESGAILKYLIWESSYLDWPIYFTHAWVLINPGQVPRIYAIRMAAVGDGCVDCRTQGGTIEKPEFWD